MDQLRNGNFAALGLESAEEVAAVDCYRSVMPSLLEGHDAAPVYRSLAIEPAAFDHGFGRSSFEFQAAHEFELPLDKLCLSDKTFGGKIYCAKQLTQQMDKYIPAHVHCFSSVNDSTSLVQRIIDALSASKVTFRGFEASSSSIECSVDDKAFEYSFSVYILELLAMDKLAEGANFIVEVQKTSGGGSPAAWASIVDSFMSKLQGLCSGGYFERENTSAPSPLLKRSSSTSSPLVARDTTEEIESAPVSEDVLIEEYTQMIDYTFDAKTPFDNKQQMIQLIAQLSYDPANASILAKICNVKSKLESERCFSKNAAQILENMQIQTSA